MYRQHMTRFLEWLFANQRTYGLITPAFLQDLEAAEGRKTPNGLPTAHYLEHILSQKDIIPIDFVRFKAEHFMHWISFLLREKPDLAFSTCSSYRSSLMYIVHLYDVPVKEFHEIEQVLTNHFVGLKKKCNRQAAKDRSVKVTVGKDPLPFTIYQVLAKEMLCKMDREFIWGRTFMIISWNLMSRSSNTAGLLYNHMDFANDAFQFYIIHQKNDQAGDKARDPKHVYANTTNPSICPILSLGIYWLMFPVDHSTSGGRLFPGTSQYERFRKLFSQRLLNDRDVLTALENNGLHVGDLGE
uniref:Core-binding (CB) domain-containing protein n=1 Tax=Guillardia theta TaxID=55529 RepID=A0A7S4NBV9_GUITH|mmetsp:Transcript_19417/g.64316  ORF Transcript_19417/g.64316 Transcript_19417/m.64316 type:complete len:299 (+) Transcript_19417:481-1377(+)